MEPVGYRAWVFRTLAALLGLVVGALSVELSVRLIYRDVPPGLLRERDHLIVSSDPRAVYELAPGRQVGVYRSNRHGFRGAEVPLAKPAGVYRIACIGDSYTFGEGVAEEETWVRILERRLRAELGDDRVAVLNFGVPGYGTRNELGLLESKALRFDPDLVLLAHLEWDDRSDFLRIVRGNLVFYHEQDPDRRIPLPAGMKEALHRRSLFYRLATVLYLERYRDEILGHGTPEPGAAVEAGRRGAAAGPIDRQALTEIVGVTRRHDVELIVLDFPVTPEGRIDAKSRSQIAVSEALRSWAEELGVPYVDMFPVLLGRQADELRVSRHDHHPNAVLARLYGEHLAAELAPRVRAQRRRLGS